MKYTIIIPTYNHCDDLLKPCVEAVLKYTNMADVELIISANGCVDNTKEYLEDLEEKFNFLGLQDHFKYVWHDEPIGFARANNEAIKISSGEKLILLNNDAFILESNKNMWIDMLEKPFEDDPHCGLSGPLISWSEHAKHHFLVFFCVMIHKEVFDRIGLLNEEYGTGGGEDIEFCVEAVKSGFGMHLCDAQEWDEGQGIYAGNFPIYHEGEATMFDNELVPEWSDIFKNNMLKVARKYNKELYRYTMSPDGERHVCLKGDDISPREAVRYSWANRRIVGKTLLEIGCTNGYGTQFFDEDIEYTGVDYNQQIINSAIYENWRDGLNFVCADINKFDIGQYDTIVAFEIIEHLDNGIELAQTLKKHCKKLLISVPYKEIPGDWGHYHVHHGLTEEDFPGFDHVFIDEWARVSKKTNPKSIFHLMLMEWTADE